MSTSTVNSLATATIPAASPTPASPGDGLASESTFLKLLIAQLKNQDPSNPSDPTQFVTQLAQFTTLEQSTQMRTDLDAIRAALEAKNAATPSTPATGTKP